MQVRGGRRPRRKPTVSSRSTARAVFLSLSSFVCLVCFVVHSCRVKCGSVVREELSADSGGIDADWPVGWGRAGNGTGSAGWRLMCRTRRHGCKTQRWGRKAGDVYLDQSVLTCLNGLASADSKESVVALIDEGSKCAICGQEIDLAGPIVATTHFIGDSNDPLWRFSDAAMHYDCFQRWPHREEFVNRYNSSLGQRVWGNGTRHLMHPDGRIESVRAD